MRLLGIIFILGLASLSSAQNGNNPSVNSLTFPVFSLNPAPVAGASISIVGASGQATWYFWASANYQLGSVISPIGSVVNAPNTLTSGNYISIIPDSYPAGVLSVDILATAGPLAPVGACNCAVATGLTSGGTNFQSNTLLSYTVSILNPQAFNLRLTNEVTGTGATSLVLRNALTGALVCNLSAGCGGGGSPGGSNTDVQFNDSASFNGSALFTFNKAGTAPVVNIGLPQSSVVAANQFPASLTVANINGAGGFGSQTPAISGATQGDGSTDETGVVGLMSVTPTSGNSNHFHAGVVGYGYGATTGGATIQRVIGVLGVPEAGATTGGGSIGATVAFDAYGPTIAAGSTIGGHVAFDSEANYGVINGTLQNYYAFQANSPGSVYTTGPYYAFYGGGGATNGTLNYGLYIDNTGFNGTNDYAIYVQAAKSYLGNTLQVKAGVFSALPSCVSGLEGTMRPVTDSTTATWGATIAGTGTHHVLAYCDGTNWTVMAA